MEFVAEIGMLAITVAKHMKKNRNTEKDFPHFGEAFSFSESPQGRCDTDYSAQFIVSSLRSRKLLPQLAPTSKR